MAPGRIDFGVGTGFSARRAMGLGAMKLADMEEYIRVVYGLLNGETLETDDRGQAQEDPLPQSRVRSDQHARSDPAARLRLRSAVAGADREAERRVEELHLRCAGRDGRAREHAAELEGGRSQRRAISTPLPGPAAACWPTASRPTARARWRRPGRAPRCCCTARPISTWRAGRTPRRCRHRCRSRSTATSRWRAVTSRRTRAISRTTADISSSSNRRRRKFVTAELIRRTTFTATEQELKQRVEALRGAGWSQIVIPITPGEERRHRGLGAHQARVRLN